MAKAKKKGQRPGESRKQVAAFKETARELGCDESEAKVDKALKKIGKAKPEGPKKRALK